MKEQPCGAAPRSKAQHGSDVEADRGNILDTASSARDEIEGKREVDRRRMLHVVLAHQLSILSISLLTLQPRAQLLMAALQGDTTAVARQINRGATLVALSDLLLSPAAGSLSDQIGRRKIMLLAPAAALPLKAAAAMYPTASMLLTEKVVCDAMRTLGGTTMSYACLSDLYQGKAYTAALGLLNSATGMGIVLAPLLASAMIARNRSPRYAYAASAVLCALHLVLGIVCLQETLQMGEPVATELAPKRSSAPLRVQPLRRVLRLFTASARLRLRSCLFGLHCLIEGKTVQDQVSILQLNSHWNTDLRSRWTSGLGLAILVGGQLTGKLIRRFGEHRFTTLCHSASFAAFLLLQRSAFWSSLVLLCIGQQRRSASSAWVISEAHRLGIGRGEVIGWIASLRAGCEAVSATLYGAVFRAVVTRGRPFNVFFLPAALVLLAEVQRMRVSQDASIATPTGAG